MQGLMQDWPLLCHRIIDHAAIQHADRPIVSRSIEGPIHTTNYAEVRRRALKVAQRLEKDGIKLGDRVATMAWNTWRHLEVWYGILGIGAVYHTVNPRLFADQIVLDRQSCRGSHDVRRSDVPADPGEIRPRAENHRALCRADRCSAHAGDDAEERRRLRGMDRRGRRRFRLEELRRKHRGRHVLHLGHHRPSQGRALLAPLQRAAFDDGGDAGRDECRLARCGAAGGADVPRQLLGPRAHLAHAGRRHGDAGRQARWRLDLRIARHLQGVVHRGGADGLADAAAGPGEDRPQAAVSQSRGDRRFGLPARRDTGVPGQLWRRGHPRLGHDRDEPARLALHAEAGICRADRRGEARRADEAGPSAVRRRDEDHRRQGQASCRGTARPSAASR